MKRIFTCLLIAMYATIANASTFCNGMRYDKEVFSGVQVTSNIVYGWNTNFSGGLDSLRMDIYQPVGDTLTPRPLIVWVHGGSFVGGTKADVDVVALSNAFAKRGYVCASIDYRLGVSFPPTTTGTQQAVFRAVHDLKAAIRFFRKDAATADNYRIDPNMIFAGGSSAGAFTALHLAYLDEPSEVPLSIDTVLMGGMEGNSGNPGYSSEVNAIVNLCGALGDASWMQAGDIPVASMHGTLDEVVPYATDTIFFLGFLPVMVVDGSYSISAHANSLGINAPMYTFGGAYHVPYASNAAYMDTTIRFVSNFLYTQLGCTPSDPDPLPNTFPTSNISELIPVDISIYPNPAKSWLNISADEELTDICMTDMQGRVVMTVPGGTNKISLELSGISGGIYFVNLTSEGIRQTRRVVILNH